MTTPLQIPVKFCKTLLASGSTTLKPEYAAHFFAKLVYEFWGFCVNGGVSLFEEGGFATKGLFFPAGFRSGSVLAAGNDGATSFGFDLFQSMASNFAAVNSGSLIGKYLVTWVNGSSSTDDGVYFIKSVEDANHLRVDVTSAGTRRLGNKSWFWDRNSINWRIVDFLATAQLTGSGIGGTWEGSHMVLQFNSAPVVNPSQATSQAMLVFHTASANGGFQGVDGNIGLIISPSGSFVGGTTGSYTFTDATPEVTSSLFAVNGSHGFATYTLIGASDFLIGETRAPTLQGGSAGNGFHIEVPKRIYPANKDPNPIAWLQWANATPSQVAGTYYNGLNMVGLDGNVHKWTTLVRSPMGAQVVPIYTGHAYATGMWQQFVQPDFRFGLVNFDEVGDGTSIGQWMTTDGLLSLSTPGQFSLARARLRRVRFTAANQPRGARFGDPITDVGSWVNVANGVLWPWDNSIMPFGPWWEGV